MVNTLNDKEVSEYEHEYPTESELQRIPKVSYDCYICGRNVKTLANLKFHMVKTHKILESSKDLLYTNKTKSTVKRLYHCSRKDCLYNNQNIGFTHMNKLKQHFQLAHMDKLYDCTKCSKKFSTPSQLNYHLKNCGTQYVCGDCGRSYIRKSYLNQHFKRSGHFGYKENSPEIMQKRQKTSEILVAIVPKLSDSIVDYSSKIKSQLNFKTKNTATTSTEICTYNRSTNYALAQKSSVDSETQTKSYLQEKCFSCQNRRHETNIHFCSSCNDFNLPNKVVNLKKRRIALQSTVEKRDHYMNTLPTTYSQDAENQTNLEKYSNNIKTDQNQLTEGRDFNHLSRVLEESYLIQRDGEISDNCPTDLENNYETLSTPCYSKELITDEMIISTSISCQTNKPSCQQKQIQVELLEAYSFGKSNEINNDTDKIGIGVETDDLEDFELDLIFNKSEHNAINCKECNPLCKGCEKKMLESMNEIAFKFCPNCDEDNCDCYATNETQTCYDDIFETFFNSVQTQTNDLFQDENS